LLSSITAMTAITFRNLPEEARRALKVRAAQHGRSTEAEIRLILQAAVQPPQGLGSALREIGHDLGGVTLNLSRDRDRTPPEPAQFE
jgi:plasmid stability protein